MNEPQVVITRKDKRIRHKILHAVAFAVTGGASGLVTAAEVVNHAGYNARTRQLQQRSRHPARPAKISDAEAAEFRREHVPASKEYKEAHQP